MISPENSRLLAFVKQLAIINDDERMVEKVESIKEDYEIDEEILNYKLIQNS